MGCGSAAAKEGVKLSAVMHTQNESAYKILVKNPDSREVLEFKYSSKFQKLSLTTLMNYLTFDVNAEHQIDGNYISIYDKSQDTYQYCVQRLIGKPIENEKSPTKGKI